MSWWNNLLEWASGFGPSPADKLDMAANKMQEEIGLRRNLAARSVALARAKQRELAQAVADYENLENAGVELQRNGNTNAVQYIAMQLASQKQVVDTLTAELQDLNVSAQESVASFQVEQADAQKLLSKHGQIKAAAQMGAELESMKKQMKAISGASTAKGAYQAMATQIMTKTLEFQAEAELEAGGATQKAAVRQALQQVEAQQALKSIMDKAAAQGAGAGTVTISVVDKAKQALTVDPIRGVLPMISMQTAPQQNVEEGEVIESEDK